MGKFPSHQRKSEGSSVPGTVLIIDDNPAIQTALDVLLTLHGITVLVASSPDAGMATLHSHDVDLVIQDMNFTRDTTSGEEGIEVFHRIRREWPDLPVILLTGWTHLATAVELVKAGAADYVAKPWDDARLLTTVRNLLQLRAALIEAQSLRRNRVVARAALAAKYDLRGIVYESDAIHALVMTAAQIAQADVPILITGPNGTGKEVIAEIIQANSACRSGPFVKVNVGALPAELMEAELFGNEAGAYTGARAREGRFEAAHGGTLFLDEIGNLSLVGQAKLLRVLQTGEFERLGSSTTRRVNVRIVSATNADLNAAISAGRFREDLLYRLNVIELYIPPLAERREDILPLARHFLAAPFELSAAAEKALLTHTWPGNVRELKNCIRRACLLSTSDLVEPAALHIPNTSTTAPVACEPELDRQAIAQALDNARGVVTHAARELGVSRQTLYRRMEKLGMKSELAIGADHSSQG